MKDVLIEKMDGGEGSMACCTKARTQHQHVLFVRECLVRFFRDDIWVVHIRENRQISGEISGFNIDSVGD